MILLWTWLLTFWPENLISSSLSPPPAMLWIWWSCRKWFLRYDANDVLVHDHASMDSLKTQRLWNRSNGGWYIKSHNCSRWGSIVGSHVAHSGMLPQDHTHRHSLSSIVQWYQHLLRDHTHTRCIINELGLLSNTWKPLTYQLQIETQTLNVNKI